MNLNVSGTGISCSKCGYNLTGATIGGKCPECGSLVSPNYGAMPSSGWAVASMVLGIVSIPTCICFGLPPLICGPLAIVFYVVAKKQIDSGAYSTQSNGMAIAGLVCGIIGTILGAGVLLSAIVV